MEAGTIINDRFRIQIRAGEGGMGVVYRADEVSTGQTVAIKVMHSADATGRARFLREAQALSSVSYPAIVACLGHGALPTGEPWMAMEWVDGEDLAKRLDRGPVTPHEALQIIKGLAGALEAIHAAGIVHRDVKPGNVILEHGEPSRARLIDFGVARMRDARTLTEFGVVLGTPAYMAPEQIRGANDADDRADLYALGVILFECVTGRLPFDSPNFIGVMTQALFERAPRIRDINPSLSPGLDALVDALLEKDPNRRFGPARAILEALDSSDLDRLVSQPPPPPPPLALGLTEDELLFVSVVFVSREIVRPVVSTADTVVDRTEGHLVRTIEKIAAPFHGRVEGLRDGTVLVAFSARGTATDQAALAARTALAIRDLGTGLPIALATGRSSTQCSSLYSDAAVRAATLSKSCSAEETAIPIDETTRGLLDTRFSIEQRQSLFFLLAEDPFGDAGRLLCGRLTPFVGREREVSLIEKTFDDVLQEPQGAAAIVVGEAGSGKSRLGREVLAMLSRMEPNTEIWVARGEAVRAGSSFGMLASALHRTCGIREGEPMDVRHQKLATFVRARMNQANVGSVITFLSEITETHSAEDALNEELRAARKDPVLMRDRLRFAFEDLVDSTTQLRPLVLLLEDLHWGDVPSIKVLDMAFQRLRSRPFFILALGRPEMLEQFPNLLAEWAPATVRLGGLSARACQQLILRIVGDQTSQDMIASIVARSAGHPLFLEELVRTIAEASSAGTNALPETVLAMVQSRVAKLPAEARRVLRAASIFGEVFWLEGVAALLGSTDTVSDVEAWLRVLCDREFVEYKRTSRFALQQEFRFRHALFREAAYAMLTDVDKATGHRLAGTFLEQLGETNASLLATHFDLANESARAAPYHARAARDALWGGDFDEAVNQADRVIDGQATGTVLGDALILKADALQWRGIYEEAGQLAELALEHVEPGSDIWFGAATMVTMISMRRIHPKKTHEMCKMLLAWGATHEWTDAFIEAAIRTALQAYVGGQYQIAESLIQLLADLHETAHQREPRMRALLEVLARSQCTVARKYDDTIRHALEAARLFEQVGDIRNAAGQRLDATFTLVDMGQFDRAIDICKDLLVVAKRLTVERLHSIATGMLGAALVADGRADEALPALLDARRQFDKLGDFRNGGSIRNKLGRCHRLRKEFDLAEAALDESELMLAELPRLRAMTHAHKALLFVDLARPTEALEQAAKGMQISEQLGRIGTDEILVRYAEIESLLLHGQRDQAAEKIAIAKERLLWMANHLTDETIKTSFLTKVDENRRVMAMPTPTIQ